MNRKGNKLKADKEDGKEREKENRDVIFESESNWQLKVSTCKLRIY